VVSSQEINQLLNYLEVPIALPYGDDKPSNSFLVDAKSEGIIKGLDPSVQSLAREFILKAYSSGIELRIVSGYRSPAVQDKLYQQGRTTDESVVTNAKAGYSKHNFGVAFDVAPVRDGNVYWPNDKNLWATIGSIGKSLGLKWGGDWEKPDLPHFEHPLFEMKDLLTRRVETIYSEQNLNFIAKNKHARIDILGLMKNF